MLLPTPSLSVPHSALLLLLAPSIVTAVTFDCDHVRVDGKSYNFKPIGGPHSILTIDRDHPPAVINKTWTVDLCSALPRAKDVPKDNQCPQGTRICGVWVSENQADHTIMVDEVIPVAGSYPTTGGRNLDPKIKRIKKEDDEEIGTGGGLEVEFNGGLYGTRTQQAVITFKCDRTRTGNEGNEDAAEEEERLRSWALDNDDDEEEKKKAEKLAAEKNSLRYIDYVSGGDQPDVLYLEWLTKEVCVDSEDEDGSRGSSGWGFFTWFIVIAFMGTATYLIFGSWLNYNRYGARGWDLLPHGDTIRDIPYLFRDWSRKVIDTIQGGGSRGGYSAV